MEEKIEEKAEKTKKPNKGMFWIGIAMMGAAAILLLTVKEDLGISPIILGFLGLITIGASKYRPLK